MSRLSAGSTGTCPHCGIAVKFLPAHLGYPSSNSVLNEKLTLCSEEYDGLQLDGSACPSCGLIILWLANVTIDSVYGGFSVERELLAWPPGSGRKAVPVEVPKDIAADYVEAALVLNLSPRASAALSRRCLQAVLRDAGNAHQHDLSKQIDAVLPSLPTHIAENVDAIRNIGNFAAHPLKDQATDQIVDVEPGEAEWTLDVLWQPAMDDATRATLYHGWKKAVGRAMHWLDERDT